MVICVYVCGVDWNQMGGTIWRRETHHYNFLCILGTLNLLQIKILTFVDVIAFSRDNLEDAQLEKIWQKNADKEA